MGRANEVPDNSPGKTAVSSDVIEALRRSLEERIEGEVRFDALSRALYATDASVYQIMPVGVVLPKSRADVVETVRLCARHGVPLTPRGAGTALSGQAICRGLVLDLSKYMHRVVEVNAGQKWAWVEPGVVLDELNAMLSRVGLQFAPDVATSDRATLGGMIANNSAGAHSVIYGMTLDHVLELEVVLSDGSVVRLGELDDETFEARSKADDLEGRCYSAVARLAREHAGEIERRYPKIMRHVGGYGLDRFRPAVGAGRPFNLAGIIVGSEGTLGVVVGAKIRLTPLPKAKALSVVHFTTRSEALAATAAALEHKPAAVEFIDRMILDQTEGRREYTRLRDFVVGRPEALLAVEFFGENEQALTERIAQLEQNFRNRGFGYHYHRAMDSDAQQRVWKLRKAGLGLLMSMKGDAKPVGIAYTKDDYELDFTVWSNGNQCAAADIVPGSGRKI